jgi:hypothetical protein
MNRRWSLISLIVALSGALVFVVLGMDPGGGPDGGEEQAAGSDDGGQSDESGKPSRQLRGVAWWPTDEKSGETAKDAVGRRDMALHGAGWTDASDGGALRFDGESFAEATAPPMLRPAKKDFSVAAGVRLDDADHVCTAVSLDGRKNSVFYLQYVDERFAFSFIGKQAKADGVGAAEKDRWYHLAGTYRQKDHRLTLYVDGREAATAEATVKEPPGRRLALGRGKFDGKPADECKGAVSDVHVYVRALGAEDVAALEKQEPDE